MGVWSGLIHQISQGVTNQVVSSLTNRLKGAVADKTSQSEGRLQLSRDRHELRVAKFNAAHPGNEHEARREKTAPPGNEHEARREKTAPPCQAMSAWADAYMKSLNANPIANLGSGGTSAAAEAAHTKSADPSSQWVPPDQWHIDKNGVGTKIEPTYAGGGGTSAAAEAAHTKSADTAKPQSALGELLSSLASAAKQAVAPIASRWQAVRDTTQNYLTKRKREFKSLDQMNNAGESSPFAGKMASEYEASKQRTQKARRAWTNAIFGRGDVVESARQREAQAGAALKADPNNAAKITRAEGALADLRKARQLQGGGLGKSMAQGLGTARQALGVAGGHLGAGFVGRVSGAVTKLAGIGATIGAGFVAAIPVIGQVIGVLATVGAAVGTGIRWASGRGVHALSAHQDDPRVYAAQARRDATNANIERLMSRDTAESTAALQEAGDIKQRKLQPWRAAFENLANNAATHIERSQSAVIDVANEYGDSTAYARSNAADLIRNTVGQIPILGDAWKFLADSYDPGFTDEEKAHIKDKPGDAAKLLAQKREAASAEALGEKSISSAIGLRNLNDVFEARRGEREQNKPKRQLRKAK